MPATGCDLLKNHVSWVREKDCTPFVIGWSTQLARGLVWGRRWWGSVEPSRARRQWLSWGTIGMLMAALSRGGAVSLLRPWFWGDINIKGIFRSHVNFDGIKWYVDFDGIFRFGVREKILGSSVSAQPEGQPKRRGGGLDSYLSASPIVH